MLGDRDRAGVIGDRYRGDREQAGRGDLMSGQLGAVDAEMCALAAAVRWQLDYLAKIDLSMIPVVEARLRVTRSDMTELHGRLDGAIDAQGKPGGVTS